MSRKIILIVSLITLEAFGFPQSDGELARATKLTEQHYYNNGALGLLPFDNPTDIDNAKEESEGYGSKIDSVYDGLQKIPVDLFDRKPLLDGIKEAEKFGNNGNPLAGVGSVVVGAVATGSTLLNKIVDAPINVVQALLAQVNKSLNFLGGKVVGLQK